MDVFERMPLQAPERDTYEPELLMEQLLIRTLWLPFKFILTVHTNTLMHLLPMCQNSVTPTTYTDQSWEQKMELKLMTAQQIRGSSIYTWICTCLGTNFINLHNFSKAITTENCGFASIVLTCYWHHRAAVDSKWTSTFNCFPDE